MVGKLLCTLSVIFFVHACVSATEKKLQSEEQSDAVASDDISLHITHRKDFPERGSHFICQHTQSDVKPVALWEAGLFDAQVVGSQTAITDTARLNEWGKKLALQHRYLSYAFGICKGGKAWVAAFPAPNGISSPLTEQTNAKLSENLQANCREWGISFAPAGLQKTKSLSIADLGKNKIPGVSGVSCTPKHSPYLGPQLWYLIPTNLGQSLTPPSVSGIKTFADFGPWLNKVRKAMGIGALVFTNTELNRSLKDLDAVEGLQHQMPRLNELKRQLSTKNISLLGENKVLAPNVQDAIWLLWNSPQHRNGLLNASANIGAITLKPEANMQRLLLVLAKARPK